MLGKAVSFLLLHVAAQRVCMSDCFLTCWCIVSVLIMHMKILQSWTSYWQTSFDSGIDSSFSLMILIMLVRDICLLSAHSVNIKL